MRTSHPDSSLSPQLPRTATAAGNTASSHLRSSTRKYTLHAKQALLSASPEAQFQPRAQGVGETVLEGRTTHEQRNLSLQAAASRSPEAVCTFARPARSLGPRLGQYPQARWRQRQHPLRLSAPLCHWPEPGVKPPRIGRERCGGGGGAAAAWSREWATRREQGP